jgi:hypothetical protein
MYFRMETARLRVSVEISKPVRVPLKLRPVARGDIKCIYNYVHAVVETHFVLFEIPYFIANRQLVRSLQSAAPRAESAVRIPPVRSLHLSRDLIPTGNSNLMPYLEHDLEPINFVCQPYWIPICP